MTSVFSARRRAEEFHALVEDTSTGSARDARLRRLPRARRRCCATWRPSSRAPDVRRRPARAADGRGRDRCCCRPPTTPAPHASRAAPHRPRAPARRRWSAASPSSAPPPRWRWPPSRAARRRALPGQAGHRERPDRLQPRATRPRARRCSPTPPTGSTRSTALSRERRPGRRRRDRRDPRRLHRPGRRGLRPAARRLRRRPATRTRSTSCATSPRPAWTTLDRARGAAPGGGARRARSHAAQVLGEIDAAAGQACPSCGGAASPQIPPIAARRPVRSPSARSSMVAGADGPAGHRRRRSSSRRPGRRRHDGRPRRRRRPATRSPTRRSGPRHRRRHRPTTGDDADRARSTRSATG